MNKPSGFGDAETRKILERAAEIDAQRPMDADTLREIALEAGISPASLEQALAEYREMGTLPALAPTPAPPTLGDRLRKYWVALLILAIVAFFFLMRTLPPSGPTG